MATATVKVLGAIGAAVLGVGVLVANIGDGVPQAEMDALIAASRTKKRGPVPKNAQHLWARQPDGGTLLRDPLPTLDDGGCQAWAMRCPDGKCAGACE